MPFDSEGKFTRVHDWEQDRIDDISIDSCRMDEEFNNYADGLGETLLRDGRVPMTGNLNVGGFSIKNMEDGRLEKDSVNLGQLTSVKTELTNLVAATKIELNEEFTGLVNQKTTAINDATSFTKTGKQNIVNLMKPRYDRAISINSGYKVTMTGVIYISCGGNNRTCWLDVDGVRTFSSNWNANYGSPDCSQILVGVGSVITFSGVSVSLFPIEITN